MNTAQITPRVRDFSQPAPLQSEQQHGFALTLMEMLVIPTFVLDAQRRVLIWNRACERLTGVPASEVVGSTDHWRCFYNRPRATLADLVLQGRTEEIRQLYDTARPRPQQREGLCAENWCDMPRVGRRAYLAADASPIYDGEGRIIAVVETLRDMTNEKKAQISLEQLATRDGLTGLANRRSFDETLRAEWQRAQRQQQPLSLLMVDVDNFKHYNDTHGHLGGDQCLQKIATALASEMRANDLVARYGGEEFAVILPNQALKGAAVVAERVRSRIERLQLPNVGSSQPYVTVSIGAATALAVAGEEPGQLVANADAALYQAKHLGRNRISLPAQANADCPC